MKTKLIAASIALTAMFSSASAFAATAVYNYDTNGNILSLSHISKLNVYGTLYDLSFSDTWDGVEVDRLLAEKVSRALSSALTPAADDSGIDFYKKNSTGEFADAGSLHTSYERWGDIPNTFDTNANLTPGCEQSYNHCEMYIVTDDKTFPNVDGTPSIVTLQVDNYTASITGLDNDLMTYKNAISTGDNKYVIGHANYKDLETLTRTVKDYYNHNNFVDRNSVNRTFMSITESPTAVPVPAAAFLFAPALLGFMGLRRKAKKHA